MSQLGMRLPGSQGSRAASMNVYTALMLVSVLALGAACALVFVAGSRIGPEGQAWAVHPPKQKVALKGVAGAR